ncbi:MAG: membrane protease subunit [Cyanobacteria bacterium]|nr:membrane protease subunit [Cyanobacteriota bacterium]
MKLPSFHKKDIAIFIILLLLLYAANLYLHPIYNVWQAEMAGKAELANAEFSKQVAIQVAKAKSESAVFEAEAEVTRAKGVAKANAIIGASLRNNEDYLKYLWINQLENNKNAVVYIPTEANLPILEAGKRPRHKD